MLDGKTFKPKATWPATEKDVAPFGYDFWYQPYHNVLISTEWGHPKSFFNGLDMKHVEEGHYGTHLNVYDWTTRKLIQKIDLGMEGVMPLEIRFLHDPKASVAFVGCALFANMFRIFKTDKGDWSAEKVIDVPSKKVDGWVLPEMPGVMTDIIISMDDKYLYFSNWLHGDIRQYDITDTRNPKLTGQVFFGGSIVKEGSIKVTEDKELSVQPQTRFAKNGTKKIEGAPQMIQLSLDGRRLYVTTSLFSPWDKQFYPELCKKVLCQFYNLAVYFWYCTTATVVCSYVVIKAKTCSIYLSLKRYFHSAPDLLPFLQKLQFAKERQIQFGRQLILFFLQPKILRKVGKITIPPRAP